MAIVVSARSQAPVRHLEGRCRRPVAGLPWCAGGPGTRDAPAVLTGMLAAGRGPLAEGAGTVTGAKRGRTGGGGARARGGAS
jgi:hypothetical protein